MNAFPPFPSFLTLSFLPPSATSQRLTHPTCNARMTKGFVYRLGLALLVFIGAGVLVSVALALVPEASSASFLERTADNLRIFFTFDYAGRRTENFPLMAVLLNRSLISFTLIGGALVVALGLGIPTGLCAALRPNNRLVQGWLAFLHTFSAMPILVLGILLILAATRLLGLPPYRSFLETAGPGGVLLIYLLPICTLAVGDSLLADIARTLRLEATRILDQPYIRAARARHVNVRYHLVRGLIPPTLATLAGKLSYLIGGSVVVEYVFGWQGLAYQVLDSLTTDGLKDYPFILAATTLFVGLSVLLHLTSELVSLASDPRLRTPPVPA